MSSNWLSPRGVRGGMATRREVWQVHREMEFSRLAPQRGIRRTPQGAQLCPTIESEHNYDGPFAVRIAGPLQVHVYPGLVFAGRALQGPYEHGAAGCEYRWPSAYGDDYCLSTFSSPGNYLLCMDITVDPDGGGFSSVNRPTLTQFSYDSGDPATLNGFQNTAGVRIALADVDVTEPDDPGDSNVVHVRQRHYGDIYVLVAAFHNETTTNYYQATMGIRIPYLNTAVNHVVTSVPGVAYGTSQIWGSLPTPAAATEANGSARPPLYGPIEGQTT